MTELRPWTWPWLVATTLARGVLATVICLSLWGALPALVGWQPTTVSSGSMLPRLHVGDVAVSRPLGPTPPPVGSVLLFDDPDHPGRLRLHRFVRVGDDGLLVTRGDANSGEDSSPVALSAVRGIGTLRVPWVALPVVWLREQAWLPLGAALLALLGLTALTAQSRRFGFPDTDTDADGRPDPPEGPIGAAEPAAGRAPAAGQAAVAHRASRPTAAPRRAPVIRGTVLVVAGVLGLLPATPAGAAFTGTTASTNRVAAAPYFRCAGAVAAAAPYFWYRMDETSTTTTTALDSSGSARHSVYGSAGKANATRACARDTGTATTFNGSTGYLSSAFYSGTLPNTFSLAIWFRTTTTRGGKLIGWGSAQTGASPVYDRHLYLTNAGRVAFGVYPGVAEVVTSPDTYNDGEWHHAVATLSTAGMRLYLDGALVAADATTTTGEQRTGGYLRVAHDNLDGWPGAPTSRFLAATLDDAALHLTALSPAQVAAQYEAGT